MAFLSLCFSQTISETTWTQVSNTITHLKCCAMSGAYGTVQTQSRTCSHVCKYTQLKPGRGTHLDQKPSSLIVGLKTHN